MCKAQAGQGGKTVKPQNRKGGVETKETKVEPTNWYTYVCHGQREQEKMVKLFSIRKL